MAQIIFVAHHKSYCQTAQWPKPSGKQRLLTSLTVQESRERSPPHSWGQRLILHCIAPHLLPNTQASVSPSVIQESLSFSSDWVVHLFYSFIYTTPFSFTVFHTIYMNDLSNTLMYASLNYISHEGKDWACLDHHYKSSFFVCVLGSKKGLGNQQV